ncbi:hypothetical protein FE633_46175 [Streptomyces montanus]|uniref:Uncharacterized protein n=1 Tax=Streptomyces montanus TaxID=2580423 RepID=A0A5R9FJ55_9ACTN|nr:hypothetical protein FE633_46175 [Streptomyces montanus]
MFGLRGNGGRRPSHIRIPCCGFSAITRSGGVEILPAGEEEVEVTESEAPGRAGVWCKREMLRHRCGAIRERSSAWTSSSRAARPRCQSGSASTWPRS